MKPYFSEDGIVIYHGDCREVLPQLPAADTVITDPVWPNSSKYLAHGPDRPYELFAEVAVHFPALSARAVIHLGVDSDPRFLCGMPKAMPFSQYFSSISMPMAGRWFILAALGVWEHASTEGTIDSRPCSRTRYEG